MGRSHGRVRTSRIQTALLGLCLAGCPGCGGRVIEEPPSPLCEPRPLDAPRHVTVGETGVCAWGSDEEVSCWGQSYFSPYLEGLPASAEVYRLGASVNICALEVGGLATCNGEDGLGTAGDVKTVEIWRAACSTYRSGSADCWWGSVDRVAGDEGPWPWRAVACATSVVCGLRGDCTPECKGDLYDGVYGYTPTLPAHVGWLPPDEPLQTLSVSSTRICGLRADGSIVCWGGDYADYREHPPPDGTFTQVAAGEWFNCALRDDGEVLCWGAGGYWDTPAAFDPAPTPPPGPFLELDVGEEAACGVRPSGAIECWGTVYAGALLDVPAELR